MTGAGIPNVGAAEAAPATSPSVRAQGKPQGFAALLDGKANATPATAETPSSGGPSSVAQSVARRRPSGAARADGSGEVPAAKQGAARGKGSPALAAFLHAIADVGDRHTSQVQPGAEPDAVCDRVGTPNQPSSADEQPLAGDTTIPVAQLLVPSVTTTSFADQQMSPPVKASDVGLPLAAAIPDPQPQSSFAVTVPGPSIADLSRPLPSIPDTTAPRRTLSNSGNDNGHVVAAAEAISNLADVLRADPTGDVSTDVTVPNAITLPPAPAVAPRITAPMPAGEVASPVPPALQGLNVVAPPDPAREAAKTMISELVPAKWATADRGTTAAIDLTRSDASALPVPSGTDGPVARAVGKALPLPSAAPEESLLPTTTFAAFARAVVRASGSDSPEPFLPAVTSNTRSQVSSGSSTPTAAAVPVPLNGAPTGTLTAHAVAPAMPGSEAAPVDGGALKQQIIHAMRLQWQAGVGEATIQLEPEHLGSLTISLKVENGAVSATMRAETAAAQQWIAAHEVDLRSGLERQGLALERLVVSQDPNQQQRFARPRRQPTPTSRPRRPADSQVFSVEA